MNRRPILRPLAALAAALLVGACTPDAPTPAASPTPHDAQRLAYLAEQCATRWEGPRGDVSFAASVTRAEPQPGYLSLTVDVDVASAHGTHEANLDSTAGYVTSPDATVVGLVTGVSVGAGGGVGLLLGSCPASDGEPGVLPDGEFSLALYGPISPTDHNHDQAEYWTADPLSLKVTDGVAALS